MARERKGVLRGQDWGDEAGQEGEPRECLSFLVRPFSHASQGISLSVEQYQALLGLVPSINDQLRKNGVVLDDDAVEHGGLDEVVKASKKSKKSKAETKKANIEATSDEDEEED